ncbi:MAG: pyridoxal phosphate-dependent aminotransferase [Acidimicrobiales bacterium]
MHIASRTLQLKESVIREMTRLAISCGAVNLSQGFPDFDPPPQVIEAATRALTGGQNQYSMSWGLPSLREALARRYRTMLGWEVDADRHVVVTCGVTEAVACAFLAVLDRGDEVIVLEPAHETYGPAAMLADAVMVPVTLQAPEFALDPDRIEAAIGPRTRAILINTPHNPTGRVFNGAELAAVAELVLRHDLVVITDEIYDEILYDGRVHVAPGSLEALRERTVTIGGLGKTFAMTGWRLGHAIAPDQLTRAVRGAHDFLTVCAATPLQAAGAAALELDRSFYTQMVADYHERRRLFCDTLTEVGLVHHRPEGAYYAMTDFTGVRPDLDDEAFTRWLTTEVGVACVPGRVFHSTLDGARPTGHNMVRFAFAKRLDTLNEAADRLRAGLG